MVIINLREDYIKSTLKRWEAIEKDESLSDEERYSLKKHPILSLMILICYPQVGH